MPRLLNEERARAMGRLQVFEPLVAVARAFNCSRQRIVSLRMRVHQTGTLTGRPRPGASRVTSLPEDVAK